jgi:prophage antirepressor-like protein
MANDLIAFFYEDQPVRIVLIDGKPWWVADDLAKLLGYRHTPHMLRMVPAKWASVHLVDRKGDERNTARNMSVVSEPGMLLCISNSKRPEAEKIRDWIFEDVIPTILRTGRYEMAGAPPAANDRIEAADNLAPALINAWIGNVNLVYRLWGRAEARAVYLALPLPNPFGARPAPAGGADLAEPLEAWLIVNPPIAKKLAAFSRYAKRLSLIGVRSAWSPVDGRGASRMTTEALGVKATSIGDGVTTHFPVPFQFIANGDLRVYTHPSVLFDPALATQLTEGVDFTISGVGRAGTAEIVTTVAVASGTRLTRLRYSARSQDADYVPNDGFPADTHELQLDRLSLVDEELDARIADVESRAIRVPVGESVRTLPYAADRALKVLAFDEDGQPVMAWIDDLETVPPAAVVPDYNIYYVKDFGAVGDSNGTAGNGTNNLAAFQAAIAAAKAAGGGRIVVSAGTYRLPTAALVVDRSNIGFELIGNLFFDSTDNTTFGRLIFDGTGAPGGRIKNNYVRGSGAVFNRAGVAVSGPNPGYNGCACLITFRNCDWFECVGPELYQSPNYGVSILNSTDGRITVHAHDQVADGVHVQDGSKRVTVANCVIHNVGDDGIGLGFWGNPIEDCTAIANSIHDVGGRGIACFAPSSGSRVIGNTIRNTWGPGLLIEANNFTPSNKWTKDVALIGNAITSAGMFSGFSRSADLACGIFVNTVGGLIDNVLIQGNTIRGSRNGHLWTLGPATGHITSITISGNTFDTIAAHGGQGAAPSGGGNSINPSDGDYSGVKVMQAEVLHLANNTWSTPTMTASSSAPA